MPKDSYDENLRRVVTVCGGQWSGRWHDDGDTESLALIFCDRKRDLSRKDQMTLMLHPEVRELFGPVYYGVPVSFEYRGWRWSRPSVKNDHPVMFYIAPTAEGLYVLKKDDPDQPFFIRKEEHLFETTWQNIHDACRLMQKWTEDEEGCTCSWRGDRCLLTWHNLNPIAAHFDSRQLPFSFMKTPTRTFPTKDWVDQHIEEFSWDDWEELKATKRVKHWKSRMADFTVISPTATADDPLHPKATAIRAAHRCNFMQIEDVRERFSARTQAGKNTRRTRDKECRVCYFGGEYGPYNNSKKKHVSPCNKWNPKYCQHGAWTKERLIDYTLERFEATLKARGSFSLQDMWVVANLCGIPFKLRSAQTKRMREWHICRLGEGGYGHPDPNQVRVLVERTARDARGSTLPFTSLAELEEFLPPFMKEQLKEFQKKSIDRAQLALWAHAATLSSWKSRTGFFSSESDCGFTSWQASIGAVFLVENSGVRIQKCWSRSEDYVTLYGFESLFTQVESLMLFQITDAEDDELKPSLNHWLR